MYTCFYHSMAQEGKNIFVMSNVNTFNCLSTQL